MSIPSERQVEEENELARERLLSEIRERSRIFVEVFGPPDKPTKHGEIILRALRKKFASGGVLPPNILDNHGRTDEYQTWRVLGHYDVLEYITQQLTWKEPIYGNPGKSSAR